MIQDLNLHDFILLQVSVRLLSKCSGFIPVSALGILRILSKAAGDGNNKSAKMLYCTMVREVKSDQESTYETRPPAGFFPLVGLIIIQFTSLH